MDKPVRILQIVAIMDAGGIENMLMNLYRSIDRTKVQFDFLVHRTKKGFFDDEILSMGGKIHRVMPLTIANLKAYHKQLNNFFNNNKEYKIVHSHIYVSSYFVLKLAKKNNIPVRIAHSHQAPKSYFDKRVYRSLLIFLLKKVINKPVTHRFACGIDAGEWLFGKKEKFTIINNAINSSLFVYNKNKSEQIKFDLGVSNSSLVVGHVGNFGLPKNYPFILRVFTEILKKTPTAKLLLVGNNKRNLKIKEKVKNLRIENNVIFTGVRSDVYNMYNAMDVFLFPSINEGLPVALIEAQAAGLKIFASNTITQEVALTEDITFLSLDDSPDYWAERILASIPYERKNNYDIVKKKGYDIKNNAYKLQKFYLDHI